MSQMTMFTVRIKQVVSIDPRLPRKSQCHIKSFEALRVRLKPVQNAGWFKCAKICLLLVFFNKMTAVPVCRCAASIALLHQQQTGFSAKLWKNEHSASKEGS